MFYRTLSVLLMGLVTLVHIVESEVENEYDSLNFEYVVKLLEKMERMEQKMEILKEEVKERGKKTLTRAIELSERLENMESSFIQFQNDVNKKLSDLDDRIKGIEDEGTAVTDKSAVPIIAFDFIYPTNSIGGKVVFNTEVTNLGEGYNKSTGIFTAPYTGLYYFSATICSIANMHVYFSIYREGAAVKNKTVYDGSGIGTCDALSTLVMVNKTERVWVQCRSKALFYANSNRMNAFSGFLVNTDTDDAGIVNFAPALKTDQK